MLVRRSQTYGQVMNTAKTGKDQCISLPDELFEIMDWHVDNLRLGDERESVLLFPSRNGGFRGHTVLDKPFAAVAKKMKLGFFSRLPGNGHILLQL